MYAAGAKTMRRSLIILLIAVAALVGTGQRDESFLWRHRNLGKALFESPTAQKQAPAELKKALDLAPDSFRDRLNYGIALLRAGELQAAVAELERAQKQNPRSPHTWFNLGIAYKHLERNADAMRQFERMVTLAPDEPVSHYNLGLLYMDAGRSAEGLREFETVSRLDPSLVAPKYRIYTYYLLQDDEAKTARALADFEQAKQRQQANGESEDMEWSYYAELYDPVQARPAGADRSQPATVVFDDRRLPGTADAKDAGMLVLDLDGDGRPGLLVWSSRGILLYRHGSEPVAPSGLEDVRDVVSVAAGDFDNDGLPDLCVLTGREPRLYRNRGGRFERLQAALPQGRFRAAVWLDFDHDYDLDLFLLGDTSVLLRNQGNSVFGDYTAHFPFAARNATAAAALRSVPDSMAVDLAVAYANAGAVLYKDRLRGAFEAQPLNAIPPGAAMLRAIDVDDDGWMDLAASTPVGLVLARNRNGKFEQQSIAAAGAFVFADLESRGFPDLASGGLVRRNLGLARFARAAAPRGMVRGAAWAAGDFEADGRTDLAAVANDGSIHLLVNRTATRNAWIAVALVGVKNLKTGAGAEVEIKSGDLYQKKSYAGVPLWFGLGGRSRVDTVRISWPNGTVQNETNQAVSRMIRIQEAPRLSGSCPMVFTWNGRGFQFITDVLGVAPLGASSGDGEAFPVDHDEYVRLPAGSLEAVNGNYEIRITEELHEVSYLDQLRLFAVDHEAGTEVLTNEKFKSPPFPEFRLFGIRKRLYPVAARDGSGHDLLHALLHRDGRYAAGFRHDSAGAADLHSLALDFGPGAAPAGKAVLVLDGWVDWADGSTFLGASQKEGSGLVFPYLQMKDAAGNWKTVVEDLGIPAGKPKSIVVDLSGKFLSGSREIRIVTNLCIYWDEIYLSEDTAPPPVRLTPIDARSADLRLRGFSRPVIDPRREQPERFDYARWTPSASWNQTPGLYTRYGDVCDLVRAIDDRFVIMGAGDELRLLFPTAGLPTLAPGARRDFLLLVDGWAKDADANTAFSQSVDPLPFHGMSRYPYPASEGYPDDRYHRHYRETYNTRPAMRFVTPLVARSR